MCFLFRQDQVGEFHRQGVDGLTSQNGDQENGDGDGHEAEPIPFRLPPGGRRRGIDPYIKEPGQQEAFKAAAGQPADAGGQFALQLQPIHRQKYEGAGQRHPECAVALGKAVGKGLVRGQQGDQTQ